MNKSAQKAWFQDKDISLKKTTGFLLKFQIYKTWYYINSYLKKHIRIDNINSIELGCGEGKISILLGLLGVKTNLLDFNKDVLTRAQKIHSLFNLNPTTIKADIIELDKNLLNNFDISVSLGLAEHFENDERQKVINSHFNVLKENGISIIWVPNSLAIFYRIAFFLRKKLELWPKEIVEIPYSAFELKNRMRKAGFKNIMIYCDGSLFEDFTYWIGENFKSLIKKIFNLQNPPISIKEKELNNKPNNILIKNPQAKYPTLFGKYFSYPLVGIGYKITKQ
ncbi:MAG: class I SAM-dependent methyltransferase [Pseudomonadota bacterium]